MTDLRGVRLAVAGAGVFGLCIGLKAAEAGAKVDLWDPAPLGDNASGIAAGMIAPLGEILLEGEPASLWPLFKQAAESWRDLERRAPALEIDRSGALFRFQDETALQRALDRSRRLGAVMGAPAGAPAVDPNLGLVLRSAEDWRLDPPSALAALADAFHRFGGRFCRARFRPVDANDYDALVIAAGAESRRLAALAPELDSLAPIKGHLLRFPDERRRGPVVRTQGLYFAPQPSGLIGGATMEDGRDDRTIDETAVADLHGRLLALRPELSGAPFTPLAGVRASTPDHLPLVGRSRRPGVLLAAGARRNGWLLGPLVGEIMLTYLTGSEDAPHAALFDPARYRAAG